MISFWGKAVFSLLLVSGADIQMANQAPDYGEAFGRIIAGTGMRLQQTAPQRPLRLKAMNDALEDLAEAAKSMASRGDEAFILQKLESSRRHYGQNSFAWLLEAVFYNARGGLTEANQAFENYLITSRSYTDFDKVFMRWDDFHHLRRIVYGLLKSRGVSFEGREKDIQMRIPFQSIAQYLRNPSFEDRVFNLIFVGVIVGGIFLFIGWFLTGQVFEHPFMRKFLVFYGVCWFTYGLWILDLIFELPLGGLSRAQFVPAVLSGTILLLVIQAFYEHYRRHHRVIEEGYTECPSCRQVIPRLHLECPECGQLLSSREA